MKEVLLHVDRDFESRAIREILATLLPPEGSVLAFVSLSDEPDISPLVEKLKREGRLALVAGRGDSAKIVPDERRVGAALVPGRAFDRKGRRLGRGGGTFDRILGRLDCRRIGVAFACQLLDEIPAETHDVLMSDVVTSQGHFIVPAIGEETKP